MQDVLLFLDHYPTEGTETQILRSVKRVGGSACNTAMVLADLGDTVFLRSQAGDDEEGFQILSTLEKKGVRCDFFLRKEGMKTGFIVVALSPDGQRTMMSFRPQEPLPNNEEMDLLFLSNIHHLHISGYILLGKRERAICQRLLAAAKKRKITISLDPGISPVKKIPEKILEILPDIDFFLPNDKELLILTAAKNIQEGIEVISSKFEEASAPVIAVKLGENGCFLHTGGKGVVVPSAKKTVTANSTGAGDAFDAGFLFGIQKGLSYENCAILGNEMGFQVVCDPHSISEKHFHLESLKKYSIE